MYKLSGDNVMDNMPLVSIIMPAYNSEKYITDSINSVIAQTYKNWELIIIDDCSIDDTARIASEFQINEPRIYLYKNRYNCGVSETRNFGISIANAQWIAFLDSDDIWDTQKLEIQIKYALENHSDFLFTGVVFIKEDGTSLSWIMNVPQIVSYKQLLKHNIISCSSVLIRKELIENIGMHDDRTHEDFALWLSVLKNGNKACGIDEPLLSYRLSEGSKSGNKLKSIVMSYRTYRSVGFSIFNSLYYLLFLIINGIRKYSKIYK